MGHSELHGDVMTCSFNGRLDWRDVFILSDSKRNLGQFIRLIQIMRTLLKFLSCEIKPKISSKGGSRCHLVFQFAKKIMARARFISIPQLEGSKRCSLVQENVSKRKDI